MSAWGRMAEMTPAEREAAREYFRKRRMPEMLTATRRKLLALENEARRYGMKELLENPAHLDAAWDREVERAWRHNNEGLG